MNNYSKESFRIYKPKNSYSILNQKYSLFYDNVYIASLGQLDYWPSYT